MSEEEKQAIEILKQEPDYSLDYYKREKAIDIVLNLIEKQQKVIDKMAERINNETLGDIICDEICNKNCNKIDECKNCIKEYFYKEIENE